MKNRTIACSVLTSVALAATMAACKSSATTTSGGSTPTSVVTTPATAPAASPSVVASSAPATPTTVPDPCSLVTPADVTSAAGGSAGAPTDTKAGLYQACLYGSSVVVLVRNIDRASFDKSAKANPGGVTAVSGIGQDAYSGSGTLLVWQNGTEVTILVNGNAAAEKPLALAAVNRL